MSTKYLQVVYFQFEYYCAFTNSSNKKTTVSAFVGPFQRFFNAYPTKSSLIKSFLKNPSEINLNKAHNPV